MILEDFRKDLLENVRVKAESNLNFNRVEFVEEIGQRLSDAEEFSDFVVCKFEGIVGKTKVKLDGYSFDEADGSLALLIADYSNDDEVPSFNSADAIKAFKMLRAFVEEALKGKLSDGSIEESQPAYGFACHLMDIQSIITKFRFYLASDGLLKTRTKDWPEETLNGIGTEFHIWDIARFHTAYISATGRDELIVDFNEFGGGLPCLKAAESKGDYQAYLCMIPGQSLAEVYEKYGSRLLEGNVRTFLSARGKVNSKIQVTLRNQPEMFFAYNNGIAATAEDVVVEQSDAGLKIISAKNLQIVNGGQTTASLALAARGTAGKKDKVDLSLVMVQMKLSVLPSEKAGELIPQIARYANSQNKVSDADFFANHPYHIRLEEFSRRIFTPPAAGSQFGTHWFYERARGQYLNEQAKLTPAQKRQFLIQNPRAQMLTKTDIAKIQNTWKELPYKVSLGAQKNFIHFSEIITKSWSSDESQFNEEYFKNLVALAILFRKTESLVSRQDWYQGGYRANIVTYTLAKLHNMISEQALGKQMDLRSIWDKQSVSNIVQDQILIIAKYVFDILTDENRLKDDVTEWAKMQLCWEGVKEFNIPLSSPILNSLQDIGEVIKESKKAKENQKQDNSILAQIAVIGVDGREWARMRNWAVENNILTSKELDLLKIASQIPSKLPSEKQCLLIRQIQKQLLSEGYI